MLFNEKLAENASLLELYDSSHFNPNLDVPIIIVVLKCLSLESALHLYLACFNFLNNCTHSWAALF